MVAETVYCKTRIGVTAKWCDCEMRCDWLLCSAVYRPSDPTSLISYWQNKAAKWPHLSHVVQHLLAVLAASTSSERLFSLAVLTLSDRRSNLSEDSVDGSLFIHGLK